MCKPFSAPLSMLTSRCFINIHRDLSSSHYLFSMITMVQMINLISNITPDTIPQFRSLPQEYIQALFVITTIFTLAGCTAFVRGRGPWSTLEAIRLFVSIVVSVGAWIQKKGEVDTERSFGELDKARYKMKGA